ncbi:hypothetical protein [Xenorhabdus lircayensis]|uniref:Secreted protein n=1 Tax=Xenorhabdus lircayensis TaxID=2763499 RepID=A0ABS0U9X8_9GAMM|nr:hypothetical protein [Xenorhabdus lircayensis]MBI6550712.1 hypothetical protein [Xenorhabdus lircayensis]
MMWYLYLSAVIFNLVLLVAAIRLLYQLSIAVVRTTSLTRWAARCSNCKEPLPIIKYFLAHFPITKSTTRVSSRYGEWRGVGDWVVYAENNGG